MAHAANVAKAKAHIAKLRRRGMPLPARAGRPNSLSVTLFAAEAGMAKEPLLRLQSALRRLVEQAAAELGVGVRLFAAKPKTPRLQDAMTYALAARRRENAREGWAPEFDIPDLRALYCTAAKGDWRGLQSDAAAALARLRKRVDAHGAGNAVRRDLGFAERCLRAQLDDDGLPADFGGALAVAVEAAGLNPTLLARRVGAKPQTVINWTRGRRSPDPRFLPVVRRIEAEVGLPPGLLVRRIESHRLSAGRLPKRLFPAELRGRAHDRLRARIARLLPEDILERHADEQHRLVAEARDRCAREDDCGSSGGLVRAHYALKAWPAKAARQFEALAADKQRIIADDDVVTLKPWSDDTVEMRRYDFSRLFGFSLSPHAGDMRIAMSEVSLALAAEPARVQRFIDFKSRRVASSYRKKKRNVVRNDAGMMANFGSLFREDGWIRRSRAMRSELGYGRRPQAAWDSFCDGLAADYKKRASRLRANATTTRDPHAPVKAILRLDEPNSAIKLLVDGLYQDYRGVRGDKQTAAKLLQDLVYTQMQEQAPFRSGTTVELEYYPDNTGHLRKDSRGWYLCVPKELFKNGKGQALEHDYYRRLVDRWDFYARLEKFLRVDRFVLLDRRKCPFLFVYGDPHLREIPAAPEERPKFWAKPLKAALAGRVRVFTARHLGWNPRKGTGIEAVRCFSPGGFRHIVATSVIKNSGDYQEAADVIADSVRVTKKHYAQYRPSDRAAKLARTQAESAKAAAAGAAALRAIARAAASGRTGAAPLRKARKT